MRKLTVILSILMLVCAIVPQATATSDSLEVIVTVEKRIFQPGSQIDITVHVFDKGTYVSADEISVVVGYYPYVEVNVTETQTGVYEGSYTIKQDDTMVIVTATVSRGTDSDTGYAFVELTEEPEEVVDFSVDVMLDDPRDYQAEPGDAVEITVTVKENGTLVDADTLELDINDQSLQYTKTETGTYKATKNIPSALNKGDSYDIYAHAQKDGMDDSDFDSFYVTFFMVLYHNITKTNTSSTFDIYVSDMNGGVVEGASVSISYDDDDNENTPKVTKVGTTDSQGKARFTITYQEIDYIEVEGSVTHGGRSQEFDGAIMISDDFGYEPEGPREEGFDVVDQGDLEVYNPGDTVTRQYTAYMNGAPWVNKEVHYYITEGFSPAYRVTGQDSINTDNNGKFSVTFTAPQEMAIINFETGRPKTQEDYVYDEDDDLVYEEDMEFVLISTGSDLPALDWEEGISVSVNTLAVGGPTTVKVTGANIPSDARVIASWFVGNADDYLETVTSVAFSSDWQYWTGGSGTFLSKENGKYVGELLLPEFMPQDEDYTIIGGWMESDGDVHLNYVVLQPGESGGTTGTASEDDGVGGDTYMLILLLVVVLVVIIVLIKAVGKPKKKTPM
jgi:hypothetical protein